MIRPYEAKPLTPRPPLVVDIETNPETGQVLDIGCGWLDEDGTENYEVLSSWGDWLDMLQFLVSESQPGAQREYLKRCYAHYGASFDWLSLVQWAHEHERLEKLTYIASGGMAIGVKVTFPDTGSVTLLDSYRLLPASLAKLCETFQLESDGVGKLAIEYLPHVLKERDRQRYYDYLKRDVLALQTILYQFWMRLNAIAGNIGKLPMTLPALALRLWRMGLTEPVMTTWNTKVKALERASYEGGRTEVLATRRVEDIRIDDANSLYPSVMRDGIYPLSYHGAWTDHYEGKIGIYEVDFTQSDQSIPPVLRDHVTRDFRYSGHGIYCSPELERLREVGGDFTVIEGYTYARTGNQFAGFVEQWYGVRREAQQAGDEAMSYIAKILMNSLYGKFGQKEESWVLQLLDSEQLQALIEQNRQVKVYGDFCLVLEPTHSEHVFCAVASFVTAYGRVALHKRLCQVIAAQGEVHACDTDSVHYTGQNLPTGVELGQWKREREGVAVYLGKKLYTVKNAKETIIRSKGIPRAIAIEDPISRLLVKTPTLTFELIEQIALHELADYRVNFERYPSHRDALLSGKHSLTPIEAHRTIRPTARNTWTDAIVPPIAKPISLEDELYRERRERQGDFKKELYWAIRQVIGSAGIAPSRNQREEWLYGIPATFRRVHGGFKPDEVAHFLQQDFPGLGIKDERDLFEAFERSRRR